MDKLAFKPWERVISDVRLIPKMIMLMVFSTILIVAKQLFDADTFYRTLLKVTQNEQLAEQHYHAYISEVVWQTAAMIIIFVVILIAAARVMLRQTTYLNNAIKLMAARDLSVPFGMQCKDEYGDVARQLEQTRVQLQEMIQVQNLASGELMELSEVMALSMSETKEAAQEEFNEIAQLATAMDEMSSSANTVAENAHNASELTDQTSTQAQNGQQFLQNTVNNMSALSTDIASSAEAVNQVEVQVEAIGSVVGTIQSISEQTNLLALNAAIEAARAGEAGRGFAVVADEVRNLAQRTQEATVEIQDMISRLQNSATSAVSLMEKSVVEAAEGVELVSKAGSELDNIVQEVSQINEMNFEIAAAATQQTTVVEEMSQNLTNVRELVDGSVVVIAELLETAEEIQTNADNLDQKIKLFHV